VALLALRSTLNSAVAHVSPPADRRKFIRSHHIRLLPRRVFEISPGVFALFKFGTDGITDETFKQEKFLKHARGVISTIDKAVDLLEQDDMDTLSEALQELGARHASYDVKYEHFPVVGEALLDTLGKAFGEEFTPEVKAAWVGVYGVISEQMSAGMKEALEE